MRQTETGAMGEAAGASMTGKVVAVTRAGIERPRTATGDSRAQARICAGMPVPPARRLRRHILARTRVFDERVLAAIERGTRQVVIVGAGYDDRALRFASPDVRFFEVDHPDTQADKRARLAAFVESAGMPTFVPVDLRTDEVTEALDAAGHDRHQPSLILCEGLLVYFDEAAVVRLLRTLRSSAAPGSELVASLAIHPDDIDSTAVADLANHSRRNGRTEPWLTILPADQHLTLIEASGWKVASAIDDADVVRGARRGRSLVVTAN